MWHDPGIRPEHHFDSGLMGFTEIIALNLSNFAVFSKIILENPVFRTFGLSVIGVVDIHRKPHRTRPRRRELYPFVVDKAGMFDCVDPRLDRGFDTVTAVRVGGNP